MSNMSRIRTATEFKNRENLLDAIKSLEAEGVSAETEGDKIFLRHRSIEGYRRKNMHFVFNQSTGVYDVIGDRYQCGSQFDSLLQKVQVAYKGQAAKKVMVKMGYSPSGYKHDPQKNVATMVARRW